MSFCVRPALERGPSTVILPGKSCKILATADTLRKAMSDAYWVDALAEVCEGKKVGTTTRYTGNRIVFVTFPPSNGNSEAGKYSVSVSLPEEFLVPSSPVENGSFRTQSENFLGEKSRPNSVTYTSDSDDGSTCGRDTMAKVCVVCGRYSVPDMMKRKKGWKCKGCKGTPSHSRLIEEAKKLGPSASHHGDVQ